MNGNGFYVIEVNRGNVALAAMAYMKNSLRTSVAPKRVPPHACKHRESGSTCTVLRLSVAYSMESTPSRASAESKMYAPRASTTQDTLHSEALASSLYNSLRLDWKTAGLEGNESGQSKLQDM